MKTVSNIVWKSGLVSPDALPCMYPDCESPATHLAEIRGKTNLNICLCPSHAELSEAELVKALLKREVKP